MEWIVFFFFGFGLPFTVYVAVQFALLIKLHGSDKVKIIPPIPVMAYVVWVTVKAYAAESNLWPIMLILCSPVAILYLWVVGYFALRKRES